MRRHCLIAFSLANFCFFIAWREVLSPEAVSYLYYWKHYPGYAALIALACNVLLLSSIFVAGFYLLRRFGGPNGEKVGQVIFLLIFVRAVNNIRAQFEFLSTFHIRLLIGRAGYILAILFVFSLIVFAIWRYGLRRVARGFALVLLIWSPFGLLGFAQATWWAVKYGRAVDREQVLAPAFRHNINLRLRTRVVWLIFDEMDERLAFAARPPDLSLPAFDRLRAESLWATNAFPPAGHTSQSIPALLSGHLIAAVKPIGPGDLLLTIPNGKTAGWAEQPDIFSQARAAGINSALVGWFHPYCRVIGNRLTRCQWEPGSQRLDTSKLSFTGNLFRQVSDLLRLLPFTGRLRERLSANPWNYEAKHFADYRALMGDAENVVGDQDFGLVFIHLPVPHPPAIYNRASGNFAFQKNGYLDNLALADRVVGQLRQKMEQEGVWEHTTLIVSSDHWWRSDYWSKRAFWSGADEAIAGVVDHRIPFIVKLAGQTTAAQYDAAFNTVLTHDLILEVLSGGISNQKDLAGWLDKHRTIGESPYQSYEDE